MTTRSGKRARSEDQKLQRQAEILAAARALIEDVGFDGVTMSALAGRAKLAKGTLYLYVRSKEELFLMLFGEALENLVNRFEAEPERDMDPVDLADFLTRLSQETPLFLPLFARLVAVIEANVADEALFAAKRRMLANFERVAIQLAKRLHLNAEQAMLVARTLMNVMQGAAQFDLTADRDPDGLPDDMREAFAINEYARNFRPAAKLILGAVVGPNQTARSPVGPDAS
ncbi:TetR/AcrR family transcriptional regulator [Aliiroseovarius sp. S2029]|uniref:TetR/AcrR family transcriptional regulator n=1 Tax=Aliiroseovarius sp. S2029 TaxID=2936988 RepID=UPI0020BD8474|nr:TetR/AcrR family transcriptional regulator [Aliiroseovarius sp. S2029]MCK8482463.1 TetR/AcrR family transcriptional regulator [Aliiroseovarius sp. S2029]